jgi:hypothetical protein
MYNPYSPAVARLRQQELIIEADRRRIAKAALKARWERRRLAGRPIDIDTSGRQPTTRPALPLRA